MALARYRWATSAGAVSAGNERWRGATWRATVRVRECRRWHGATVCKGTVSGTVSGRGGQRALARYRRATSAGAVRLGGLRCSQCDGWSVTADPVQLAADVAVACSVPLSTSGHADFGGSPTRRIRWIRRMLGIVGTRKRPSQTSGCREARRCRVVFGGALNCAPRNVDIVSLRLLVVGLGKYCIRHTYVSMAN